LACDRHDARLDRTQEDVGKSIVSSWHRSTALRSAVRG
jgi:hypothetical protein